MTGPSTGHTPQAFDVTKLSAAPTPAQRLNAEVNRLTTHLLGPILSAVASDLNAHVSSGTSPVTLAESLATKGPIETAQDHRDRIKQAISNLQMTHIPTTPIVTPADASALITKYQVNVDPVDLCTACNDNFRLAAEANIEKVVRDTIKEVKNKEKDSVERQNLKDAAVINGLTGEIHTEIIKSAGTPVDSLRWIEKALALCEKLSTVKGNEVAGKELEKFDLLELAKTSSSYFNTQKSLGSFIAGTSHVAAIGALVALPLPMSPIICSGVMLFNCVAQCIIDYGVHKRVNKFKDSLTSNIKEASNMSGVVLFSGVMHHLIDKLRPTHLINNDCVKLFGNTKETTISHTLQLVRSLALLVYDDPKKPDAEIKNWMAKDFRVNSAWAQVESNMENFFGRIKSVHNFLSTEAICVGLVAQLPLAGYLAAIARGIY